MTSRSLKHGPYAFLAARAARCEPALYAVLRVAFGAILFTHGLPKALGESHGSMGDPMAGSIHLIGDVMGLPFAPQLAFLVMLLETAGAAMLALGALTRAVALAFVFEMIGISAALGPTWPWIDRGIEYPVLMGLLALYVVARGGGHYSVDGMTGRIGRGAHLRAPGTSATTRSPTRHAPAARRSSPSSAALPRPGAGRTGA